MSARIVGSARAGFALGSATSALLVAGHAFASQGPGIAPGTAGATTQLGMAIIVYGVSALVIAAGAIGALRRRGAQPRRQ